MLPAYQAAADEVLEQLTERVSPTDAAIGASGAHMLAFEDRAPGSSTFGRVVVWIQLDHLVSWVVRPVGRIASTEAFSADRPYRYEVSIQGSYYGKNERGTDFFALGLVISNGVKLANLKSWKAGGVLAFKEGVTSITPTAGVSEKFSADQAIQSMPIIIRNGVNAIWEPDTHRFNRVAVGLDRQGHIVIAGAFATGDKGATLYEFADALIAVSRKHGDPLVSAITTDGGPSAHIYVPRLNLFLGSQTTAFVPNVIDFCVSSPPRQELSR